MEREDLRRVEVFRRCREYEDYSHYKMVEEKIYQGYFHEFTEGEYGVSGLIEKDDGRLEVVPVDRFRFLIKEPSLLDLF